MLCNDAVGGGEGGAGADCGGGGGSGDVGDGGVQYEMKIYDQCVIHTYMNNKYVYICIYINV